ncbi:hypothetical protein [Arthrobacter zhaoguopingii]|uniref:hypothetical protein n=1 Tax=Arthrobacter zhaoguopingii TaxID=2681491 RepID=UPI00135AE70B|nr:hypothetical protein [Arthrobacter zhaoguopingii]
MNALGKDVRFRRVAAAAILPMAVLGATACSTAGSEEGASVEDIVDEPVEKDEIADPYAGQYDEGFQQEMNSYVDEEVTLSATVNEIISPVSFTIAGTDDTTVDELLIVHDEELPDVDPGQVVEVTGTVHEALDLPTVEEERGIDLEDDLYEDWDSETYVEAVSIDASVS